MSSRCCGTSSGTDSQQGHANRPGRCYAEPSPTHNVPISSTATPRRSPKPPGPPDAPLTPSQPTKQLTISEAKTSAGLRALPLIAGTLNALNVHRRRQLEERVALGPLWRAGDAVFNTETGLRLSGRQALRAWHEWTEAAGLGRRRFHSSRHTAATLMLQRGVPLEVVSAALGHASLRITSDIYADVGPGALRRALAKLDEVDR